VVLHQLEDPVKVVVLVVEIIQVILLFTQETLLQLVLHKDFQEEMVLQVVLAVLVLVVVEQEILEPNHGLVMMVVQVQLLDQR
tara:strand:+ start:236 stop:484 length:249 start_codon:yes stop_codon:yes gene_type:complete